MAKVVNKPPKVSKPAAKPGSGFSRVPSPKGGKK